MFELLGRDAASRRDTIKYVVLPPFKTTGVAPNNYLDVLRTSLFRILSANSQLASSFSTRIHLLRHAFYHPMKKLLYELAVPEQDSSESPEAKPHVDQFNSLLSQSYSSYEEGPIPTLLDAAGVFIDVVNLALNDSLNFTKNFRGSLPASYRATQGLTSLPEYMLYVSI